MKRSGFTIIELVVVLTVMAALLVFGTLNMRSSQASGRDLERKTDVQTIATNLESYYTTSTNGSGSGMGVYPSTSIIGSESTYLPNITTNSLKAPGQTSSSLVAATNNVETTAGVLPQPTINTYVYQPLTDASTLCTASSSCRSFLIFYKLEDGNVYYLASQNQ